MKNQLEAAIPGAAHKITAKIGNVEDCRRAISAAIAKRAFEIYQRAGCRPGCDQENWRAAEREILPMLNCGILMSKDNVIVEFHCSGLGAKDLEKIEVCVEPHRLILVGKRRPEAKSGENINVYRVLPLKEEFDPNSAKLRQRGSIMEVEIRKSQARTKSAGTSKKSG